MSDNLATTDAPVLPVDMPVGIILERRPSSSRWQDFSWEVTGVVPGEHGEHSGLSLIQEQEGCNRYLYAGLKVKLFEDECESYYHNMKSPKPGCFVVARKEDDDLDSPPEPFLISLSFDEAHAYLEGDDLVYAVDVPPALYRWTEAYVIEHYVAEKRKKRKRKDWKAGPEGDAPAGGSKA